MQFDESTKGNSGTAGPHRVFRLKPADFDRLFALLKARFDHVIGPRVRDETVVYDEINRVDELPIGYTDEQSPGRYRLRRGDGKTLFGYNTGVTRWADFLQVPGRGIWSVNAEGEFTPEGLSPEKETRRVFLGVRGCELAGIDVLDRVLARSEHPDEYYVSRRENIFIVAVQCTVAAETCFCTSMNTGPECREGGDIVLTEVVTDDEHYFLAHGNSVEGKEILGAVEASEASASHIAEGREALDATIASITKPMTPRAAEIGAPKFHDHSAWDKVAERCLSCTNCTMVCPTCFCVDVVDNVDAASNCAQRSTVRDSCFSLDYSFAGGKSVRSSVRGRYHQWLTHKLSTWHDQFGMSGCTGCGHCITWCPASIDIREEARALTETEE